MLKGLLDLQTRGAMPAVVARSMTFSLSGIASSYVMSRAAAL